MNLQQLSDEVLEKNLVELFSKERTLLCEIILHVMEIASRRSYLKSHPSLFEYLQKVSKYSHGTTQRRISAALLAIEIPQVLGAIKSGRLNSKQIEIAQSAFKQVRKQNKKRVPKDVKLQVLQAIAGKTAADSEIIVCSMLGIKPKDQNKVKRQADGSVRAEVTYTKEQWAKIERAKELLSHSVPSGDIAELMVYMCERVIAHKDKTIPKAPRKTKSSEVRTDGLSKSAVKTESEIPSGTSKEISKSESKNEGQPKIPSGISRENTVATAPRPTCFVQQYYYEQRLKKVGARTAVPMADQRAVFVRDKCCRHKNPLTGEVCGSRWQLQVDHIQPIWAGGTNELENLRLLCGAHNREMYRRQAGVRPSRTEVKNH
jgi:hypothetical protein